jgi:hypothetical protein
MLYESLYFHTCYVFKTLNSGLSYCLILFLLAICLKKCLATGRINNAFATVLPIKRRCLPALQWTPADALPTFMHTFIGGAPVKMHTAPPLLQKGPPRSSALVTRYAWQRTSVYCQSLISVGSIACTSMLTSIWLHIPPDFLFLV